MGNIRIAILSACDNVCAFLDNRAPKALHYYSDELHEYLKGSANTYTFKASACHEDSIYLVEGNKLAFRYRNRDYYLNIMQIVRDEYEVEVTAYSLSFELLNEQKGGYSAIGAMTFAQYLSVFDYEKVLTLNINEVSNKFIKNEWTGMESMLARLFSLANVFDAELEFIPVLNDDYSLGRIVINIYQAHSDTAQGVGADRADMVLRYGKNVSGITKTSSVTELYTAICPIGRDNLTISNLDKTEYDADGKVEYRSPSGNRNIYAVQARDRFPSNTTANVNERYIAQVWNYDTDNVNMLYGQALAELKKNCVPQVKYEVDGYYDTGIGDTISIADEGFNPPLYLKARVTDQIRSFTDPSRDKTVFDNFKELQSEIDPTLLAAVNKLIEVNKTYTCTILTDNGIVFKNGQGSTTLTAAVMDVGKDMTNSLTIRWTKDGAGLSTGKSIIVNAADITAKAVYRYEAVDAAGIVRGAYEVTVSDLEDGKSQYLHLKYSNDGGKTFTGNNGEDPGKWMGYYVDFTQTDSDNPNKYSWVKVEGPKGEQGTQGPQGERGDSGGKGDKGDPMGILELPKEPPTKYEGMLWKHTGTVDGFIHNSIYRWTGSSWELFKFRADNIEADSLSAICANLGTVNAGKINGVEINSSEFRSDFVAGISTHTRAVGTATVRNGQVNIEYEIQGNATTSDWEKGQTGSTWMDYSGVWFVSRDINGNVTDSMVISPTTINQRAPNNHAASHTGYGVGSTVNYGHVKTRNDLNASSYVAGESLSSYQGYLLNQKVSALGTKIQRGSASDISVVGNTNATRNIVFPSAFASTPIVVATPVISNATGEVAIYNVSTTGFTVRITNRGSLTYSYGINWIAMI